ncbi:MAG TPA: Cof-type HAD-IIB family hydrolase [Symbiobacteriaceae bacterium]|nr:Cof-type HAD-IIB family hydrolase [Symbiobacteriaceae bacterium]
MSIRLICLDLDGTTLRRDGTISERTVAALRRAMAAGATVTIATGRMHGSAAIFGRRIGINGPIISSNGALIRDVAGKTWLHRPLPASAVAAAAEVVPGSDVQVELYTPDTAYVRDVAGRQRHLLQWWIGLIRSWAGLVLSLQYMLVYRTRPLDRCRGPVDKIYLEGRDAARLQEVAAHIMAATPEPLSLCSSGPWNLELTAPGVSKGSAVAWLVERFGLAIDQVLVAGDSYNDLSMFDLDCLKIAMGNAEDGLKERASFVTASNEDDGVARAVERFVLGEATV